MKPLVFSICVVLVSSLYTNFLAETILAINNFGKWHDPNSWNLNRLPNASDLVIIPSGITLKIDENILFENNLSEKEQIEVNGTLLFYKNCVLRLDSDKTIKLGKLGKIKSKSKTIRALILVKEKKIWDSFSDINYKPKVINSESDKMNEHLRYKDSMLVTWDIKQDSSVAYYSVLHSYDGKTWTPVFEQKAVDETDSTMHYICLKGIKLKGNTDFVQIISYDFSGNAKTIAASCLTHNFKKDRTSKNMTFIPKSLLAVATLYVTKMLVFGK